ncbi:hypothetical protein VNO77_19549 [Canavalia gladiata]|uniref:Uncharacterized protein n=1 Tax=Canavalia gladiata TaxID=3824 RepID=A0AAN9QIL2_CANGL
MYIAAPVIYTTIMHGSKLGFLRIVVQFLGKSAGKLVEQIFMNGVKLLGDLVVEFFTAPFGVSAEELEQNPAHVLVCKLFISAGRHHVDKAAWDSLKKRIKYQAQPKYIEGEMQPGQTSFCLVIPRQLCDNAGFDATDALNKLRQKHALAFKNFSQHSISLYAHWAVILKPYTSTPPLDTLGENL